MKVIRRSKGMKKISQDLRRRGRTIGFVPTMGYFHEGHLSLIRRARRDCQTVVVSIFVNPTQFGPGEDYAVYPRDSRSDFKKAKASGVDYLFFPSTQVMYPPGSQTFVAVEQLSRRLCGPFRPVHFRGVTTVVAKLFELTKPHVAYFGQKDYQQFRIIQQMIRDLQFDVKAVLCPTVREHDGLAMSSRNRYLSSKERQAATVLFRSLQLAKRCVAEGETSAARIRSAMLKIIEQEPMVKLEYLSLCDPGSLEEVPALEKKTLVAVSARIGKTRLIDNVLLRIKSS